MPVTRTSRRVRATSAAVLAALVLAVGACGDDPVLNAEDTQPGPVQISTTAVGQQVSAYATVTDILSLDAFVLTGARADGGELLVAAEQAVPLRPGVRVTVTGTVQEFDEAARVRLGLEPREVFAPYVGQRYLLATSVDGPVQGEIIDEG